MTIKSVGSCEFCKKELSVGAMTRHLPTCLERIKAQRTGGEEKVFLIKASAGPFWVYFEASSSDTLESIDSFLRHLWLDCCGHMSMFVIAFKEYGLLFSLYSLIINLFFCCLICAAGFLGVIKNLFKKHEATN